MSRSWQRIFVGLSVLFSVGFSVASLAQNELVMRPSGDIELNANSVTLSQMVNTLSAAQTLRFSIDPSLAEDTVSLSITADNWTDLIRQAFSGYNWIQQKSANGMTQIFVLERTEEIADRSINDSTPDESITDDEPINLLALDAEDSLLSVGRSLTDIGLSIPEQLSAYPGHALQAIELDIAILRNLSPGDVITLSLPSGQHPVTFIEAETESDDGTSSWVGYISDEEADYDVIITSGEDGLFAHINTPDGLQTIETINGQQWWIDVANSGLDSPDYINDTFLLPTTPAIDTTSGIISTTPLVADQGHMSRNKAKSALNKWKKRLRVWKKRYKSWKRNFKKTRAHKAKKKMRRYLRLVRKARKKVRRFARTSQQSSRRSTSNTRIDLMIAYTRGVNRSRAKHMVKLANNAFNNSGVRIQLRVVRMLRVGYPIASRNNNALTDVTYSNKELRKIKQLRRRHKADLVTLLRPFRYPAQDSCGIAWLGGANGSNFHPITGFSVVSIGANNGYYCSNYTLAHEIGHNLGSAHDRRHAGAAGAYRFSYGFGRSGKAGSIMSYINPEVGRFSSPGYRCRDIRCGAGNANNVKSLNRSRKRVSRYY